MDVDESFRQTDRLVFSETGHRLTRSQEIVFRGVWGNQSYQEMAQEHNYALGSLQQAGHRLWIILSKVFGEEVRMATMRIIVLAHLPLTVSRVPDSSRANVSTPYIPYPGCPLASNATLYVERLPIETACYAEIDRPASLLRIKAPEKMGKTSLLNRITSYANGQGYQTAQISLRRADHTALESPNQFLHWLCANASHQLGLMPQFETWDEDLIGYMTSCTDYFENNFLQQGHVLVLSLDDVDKVFNYPDTARSFLSLLRSWYEKGQEQEMWQQLRLVIAYSTEDYPQLEVTQSPFNVGMPIELREWNLESVEDLAARYQLDWAIAQRGEQLMDLIGGHPYLVQLAAYHIHRGIIELDSLLVNRFEREQIYRDHLRCLFERLNTSSKLREAMRYIVTSADPVSLPQLEFTLDSMGLTKRVLGGIVPRCELYRQYFRDVFECEEQLA